MSEIERTFVSEFSGKSRIHREKLFLGLEEAIQSILMTRLPCNVCIDGSFLTKKPFPDDVDIVVAIDSDVDRFITEDQRQVIDLLNGSHDFFCVDSVVFINYPHGHPLFGLALDAREATNGYGIEHAGWHVKGYVVLRIWETDVGLRICR